MFLLTLLVSCGGSGTAGEGSGGGSDITTGDDSGSSTDTNTEGERPDNSSNAVPVASADIAQINEDTVLSGFNVLTNDSDPDDDALSLVSADPSIGNIDITAGEITYTPPVNFFGEVAVNYTISDGSLQASSALTIEVLPINDAPVARDDSATVQQDSSNNVIDVLSNDSDVDDSELTIIQANANSGSVSIQGDNIVYTPNTGFTGADTITYSIEDSSDESSSASVDVLVIEVSTPPAEGIEARITPSRTSCVSPCTVVFSAIDSNAEGVDEHEMWHRLIYRFDFYDIPERDFPLSGKPQHFEVGGPMATRTLLCDDGTCQHRVGLRVQDENGMFDDAYAVITVNSESVQFSAANTVCISNTLNTSDDWTTYDKACPAGAIKRTDILLPDDYSNRLVLFKRGDVFDRNLYPRMGQSNYKIGYFGNSADLRPEFNGELSIGPSGIGSPLENPPFDSTGVSDSDVTAYGWTENATIEGLRVARVSFPMSYQHVGIHDMDLDYEDSAIVGGSISVVNNAPLCHRNDNLTCSNVPFPKGAYISNTLIKGQEAAAVANVLTLNIANVPCGMAVYTGIVDTELGNSGEHNMRDMGFWKTNVSHSYFTGHHKVTGRSKNTIRSCGDMFTEAELVGKYILDPEGRTRDDADTGFPRGDGNDEYSHLSRFYLVQNNIFGGEPLMGDDDPETFSVATSSTPDRDHYMQDILITRNVFNEDGIGGNASFVTGEYMTCVGNTYAPGNIGCGAVNVEERNIIEERTTSNTLPSYLPLIEPSPAPAPPVSTAPTNIAAGRPVLNVIQYRAAGTSENAALDSGNFSNWDIQQQSNASVSVASDNTSISFSRNIANDGANARAYVEFTFGPLWNDDDVSVCMDVSGYDENSTGTRNVSLEVVGSHLSGQATRTPTSNGTWCTVLNVISSATTTVVRIGIGVTGNDTRTNSLTISNVSFSPTHDNLPNEYVDIQPQFSVSGDTTGWTGGVFNYEKNVTYNAATGLTVFTPPASPNTDPAVSHVMTLFDSYGGFVSRATTRWLMYGLNATPRYTITNNAVAGRALGTTYQSSLLDTIYANAPTPKPGIFIIRQAGNDLKVNAETAEQTDFFLQWHIDWAQSHNMHVILTTATPFSGSGNWTQVRQDELEEYNDLVRARSGQFGITVIDEYALLDTNSDGQIDGDEDVPDSIDNGEGFAANDLVHATASGYRVLAEAHDAAIKQIIAETP